MLSKCKEIVFHKWASQRGLHLFLAFLYWVFTVLVTLSLIFYRNVPALKLSSFGLLVYTFLLELLELVVYAAYHIRT